jgi:23S rRNA pseudouridine1911/1915/1917 synthase
MYYKIIKENSDYMLVWKPANLPTTPTRENPDCLISYLVKDNPELKNVEGYGKSGEYGLLNRLDNKTAGIIIVAKNDNSFKILLEQFSSMKKIYLALSYNLGSQKKGKITIPLAHHHSDPKRMVWVENDDPSTKKFSYRGKIQYCETDFEVISDSEAKKIWKAHLPSEIPFPDSLSKKTENNSFVWVKCSIQKGKRHQIRIHLKYVKYPVLGDELYSSKDKKNAFIDYYALFGVGIEGLI